jgi:hypothetical protein
MKMLNNSGLQNMSKTLSKASTLRIEKIREEYEKEKYVLNY